MVIILIYFNYVTNFYWMCYNNNCINKTWKWFKYNIIVKAAVWLVKNILTKQYYIKSIRNPIMICWYCDSTLHGVSHIYNFQYDIKHYNEFLCHVLKEISATNNFVYCMHWCTVYGGFVWITQCTKDAQVLLWY